MESSILGDGEGEVKTQPQQQQLQNVFVCCELDNRFCVLTQNQLVKILPGGRERGGKSVSCLYNDRFEEENLGSQLKFAEGRSSSSCHHFVYDYCL